MDMFFRYIDHYEPHYIEGDLSVFDSNWKGIFDIDTCLCGKNTYNCHFYTDCDLKYEEISSITIDSLELFDCQYFYCSDINHCSFSYLIGRFEYIDEEGITRFYEKVLVGYNLDTQEYIFSCDVVS